MAGPSVGLVWLSSTDDEEEEYRREYEETRINPAEGVVFIDTSEDEEPGVFLSTSEESEHIDSVESCNRESVVLANSESDEISEVGDDEVSDNCSSTAEPFASQSESEQEESLRDDRSFDGDTSLLGFLSADEDDESRKAIVNILLNKCRCGKDCLFTLNGHTVNSARQSILLLTRNEKREWLRERIAENSQLNNGKIVSRFYVGGVEVCQDAFSKVFTIAPRTIKRVTKLMAAGAPAEHGNKGLRRACRKTDSAIAWMRQYFNLIGDRMPHKNQVHLPSWECCKAYYHRYKSDMEAQATEDTNNVVSISMFYKIWKRHFKEVVIPEENRFSKCDICVKIKMEKRSVTSKEKKLKLDKAHEEHLSRTVKERDRYYSHRSKARSNPDKCVTIIIDGMDQSKSNLPNTKLIAKSTSSLWKLRTHITGLLVHTQSPYGKYAYGFVDLLLWPHDCNLVMTLLTKVLFEFQKERPLPQRLYIQMDNTCKENKNRFFLTYCAILVELKIFRKVKVNFLVVGHTHEDIDQLFSKVAEEINARGCESLPELLTRIASSSSKPQPDAKIVSDVWDYKKWMEPHQAKMGGHSKYHIFRFSLNSSQKAVMHYKRYSSSPWEPSGTGLELLKGCPDPSTPPPLVDPTTRLLDLERFIADLPKYKAFMSPQAWQSWQQFIDTSHSLDETRSDAFWEVTALVLASKCVPDEEEVALSAETRAMMEKETRALTGIKVSHTSDGTQGANGPKRKRKRKNTEVHHPTEVLSTVEVPPTVEVQQRLSSNEIKVGDCIACYLSKYEDEEPQLGVVRETTDKKVVVAWMTGDYDDSWSVMKQKNGKDWTERIAYRYILRVIKLREDNRMSDGDVTLLKADYAKI